MKFDILIEQKQIICLGEIKLKGFNVYKKHRIFCYKLKVIVFKWGRNEW